MAMKHYGEEEIEHGLMAVALCAGNTAEATRQLALDGVRISRSTLDRWTRTSHAERYLALRAELVPKVHAKIAEECEDMARRLAEVERETVEKFQQELPSLKASEAAGAVRNITTSKGINVDKAAAYRGRPTAIVEHRPSEEIMRELERFAIEKPERKPDVEGTAEEIPALVERNGSGGS